MKIKVFTLHWAQDGSGFDDTPVQVFLETRRLVEVVEHFFVHERMPTLVLLLTWRDKEPDPRRLAPSMAKPPAGSEQPGRPDLDLQLNPEEQLRYDALRQWRNQYARQTGRPPYVILTNRQVAAIAQRPTLDLAALGSVPGIGASRLDEFGGQLVALLAALPPASAELSESPPRRPDE